MASYLIQDEDLEMAVQEDHPLESSLSQESVDDLFRAMLKHAVLAPSGHNTQPWLFKLSGENSLDLIADRTRALPVVDPLNRELTISCGAALDHLEVAASHYGRALAISLSPNPSEPDVLARVKLISNSTENLDDLFEAIPKRRTTRAKFDNRPLPEELAEQCRAIAEDFGVSLDLITDNDKRASIADLVAEGDRIQFADASFRRELAAWVHSRRRTSADGMSGEGFGMPDVLSSVGSLVIRTFDIGKGVAAGDRDKIVEGSPTLAVFSSIDDSAHSWLQTGRALSRVLLTLAANGVTSSYLNPPVELAALRPRLQTMIGARGVPQLLLRFGYGPSPSPTVRRAVDQVIVN